jgi:hypothetical protein
MTVATVDTTGPIPRRRSFHWQVLASVWCRRKGHRMRCWIAPPGTPNESGHQAFRVCRCYRCGIEVAE